MSIDILIADYNNEKHAQAICDLLDDYASDPMGGGEPLPASVLEALVGELSKRTDAFTVLCFIDGQAAGLVNCFEGFSTFRAKPLVNIHDVTVRAAYRGRGLSHKMIAAVEQEARNRGCCKLTLEVFEGNVIADTSYRRIGFAAPAASDALGQTLFLDKLLA